MMRLLVMLVYVVLGFALWRLIRIAVRVVQGGKRGGGGNVYSPRKGQSSGPRQGFPQGEIQDAKFEDLAPPPKNQQGTPNNPQGAPNNSQGMPNTDA